MTSPPATGRFGHVEELAVGQQTPTVTAQVSMANPAAEDDAIIWQDKASRIAERVEALERLLTE